MASVDASAKVVGITDSIQSTVDWLQSNNTADLILMDIELADGQSFEILNLVEVKAPVIFTTSYDEFALRAFKVNSVDYLLKSVQVEDLQVALAKYKKLAAAKTGDVKYRNIGETDTAAIAAQRIPQTLFSKTCAKTGIG